MNMVLGQYSGNVGSGKRVSFPKKFRQELGEKLILTKGLDGNLLVVSEVNWRTLLEGTEEKPIIDKKARDMQAFLLGNASEVVLDDLGRFVIPEFLRIHAGITREVIFAGVNKYVALWDKERWEIYQKQIEERIRNDTEKLPGNE